MGSRVYFHPISDSSKEDVSSAAGKTLKALLEGEDIGVASQVALKVHTGERGNVTFIRPSNFDGIIDLLAERGATPRFTETNTAYPGARTNGADSEILAREHGFTRIPFFVADGADGFSHREVPIRNGKYYKTCMVAEGIASQRQLVVLSHFKGHIMGGFGGAIKQLGIGCASKRGKIDVHHGGVDLPRTSSPIDLNSLWRGAATVYRGPELRYRIAEYALAASQVRSCIYVNFALSITAECDCDGKAMAPLYQDLGIFASTDPVAVDKACFDALEERERKVPFEGGEIFAYAEKIGLGSTDYVTMRV
jgi:hypothetical protein